MKKFEFKLASVMRVRETQRTVEKSRLEQLLSERARLENQLTAIKTDRERSLDWIQNQAGANQTDFTALSGFLLGAKAATATTIEAIERCNEKIEAQRARTLIAERNYKLLEKLKAKRLSEWQHEFDRELEAIAQEAWQAGARARGAEVSN